MNFIFDYIQFDLDILFVGFNLSICFGEMGYYFVNLINCFWMIFYKVGLIECKYYFEEDYLLLQLGYGLINIVECFIKVVDEIIKEEYVEGREILKKKIVIYMFKIVCFVGKGVYQQYSGCK